MPTKTDPTGDALLDSADDLSIALDMCHLISECDYKPAGSTAHAVAERIERALERLNTLLAARKAA